MKLIVAILFALFAVQASAVKVRADVAAGTTQCGFYLDTGAVVVVPATPPFCDFDVSTVTTGAHVVAADARTTDPLWGAQTSAKSAPLNFTRPAAPTVPSGLVLAP